MRGRGSPSSDGAGVGGGDEAAGVFAAWAWRGQPVAALVCVWLFDSHRLRGFLGLGDHPTHLLILWMRKLETQAGERHSQQVTGKAGAITQALWFPGQAGASTPGTTTRCSGSCGLWNHTHGARNLGSATVSNFGRAPLSFGFP